MNRRKFLAALSGAALLACGFDRRLTAGIYEYWRNEDAIGLGQICKWMNCRVGVNLYLTNFSWERHFSATGCFQYVCRVKLENLPNRRQEWYGSASANDRQELAKLIASGRKIA